MSGFLRRIKRSRPADAGEPLPEGQAAAPEGAPSTAEPAAPGPAPASPPPVLLADPSVPAGVDPADAPLRPPAGRRGRLRRRLRYLRRARELMLRDVGGLLYEIHRTGNGDVPAHANVIDAKVRRIAGLDAEAHAIEAALGSPRPEAVVFQPGVGGTCATCGELYGSDARFCASCGAAVGPAAPAAVESPTAELVAAAPAAKPRRGFWPRRRKPPAGATESAASEETAAAPGDAEQPAGEQTAVLEPRDDATQPGDERTSAPERPAAAAGDAATPGGRPATSGDAATPGGQSATSGDAATRGGQPGPGEDATPGDQPRHPYAGLGNGRAEDGAAPGLSSGDPLISRRRT